jgi:hypothetical protein
MFVPAMFALLVALATKSLLVESMREWDSRGWQQMIVLMPLAAVTICCAATSHVV